MLTHDQIHCWNVHHQPGDSSVGKSRFSVWYFQPQVFSMNYDCRLLIVPVIEITMNLQCFGACSQGVGSNIPGALGWCPLPGDKHPHPLLSAGDSRQLPRQTGCERRKWSSPRTHPLCTQEGAECQQTRSLTAGVPQTAAAVPAPGRSGLQSQQPARGPHRRTGAQLPAQGGKGLARLCSWR